MTPRVESISTIISSFPLPELTTLGTVTQKPSYQSLLAVQKELNTNSASIDTSQGTGIHGLLVLTMSPDDFAEMTAPIDNEQRILHPPPANPGVLPVNPTAAQERTHQDALYHHQVYHSTDKALKKMLLVACLDIYISAIKHPRTGYANITTLQLLTHLWATYGEIKPEDLDANLITMATAWHPSTPIETLFLQIDDGIDFASAGDSPIDDSTAVRIIYKIIHDTGVFELACRDWRALPRADKTLAHFKTFFQKANNDRNTTTGAAGYHTANATITESYTTLLEAHNKLKAQVEKIANKTTANKTKTTTTTPASKAAAATTPSQSSSNNIPTFKGYCHTHGHTLSHRATKIHDSMTCQKRGENHNEAATATNTLGGNERVWVPRAQP